jgi:hypothetical protein
MLQTPTRPPAPSPALAHHLIAHYLAAALTDRDLHANRVQRAANERRRALMSRPAPPPSRAEALHQALAPLRYAARDGKPGARPARSWSGEVWAGISPVRAAVVHRLYKVLLRAGVDVREGRARIEAEAHVPGDPRFRRRTAYAYLRNPATQDEIPISCDLIKGWRWNTLFRRYNPRAFPRTPRQYTYAPLYTPKEVHHQPATAVRRVALHMGGRVCRACGERVARPGTLLDLFCRHCDRRWHAVEERVWAALRLALDTTIPALLRLGIWVVPMPDNDRRWGAPQAGVMLELIDLEGGGWGWAFWGLTPELHRIDPDEALIRLTDEAVCHPFEHTDRAIWGAQTRTRR